MHAIKKGKGGGEMAESVAYRTVVRESAGSSPAPATKNKLSVRGKMFPQRKNKVTKMYSGALCVQQKLFPPLGNSTLAKRTD